ncbi:MAG: universal stress protein [Nitrospira sp.]|nr:universal stress protein [Nitrospira sp.]
MRVVVAVDRSDPTFKLVHAVTRLYSLAELTLVHAVDHGLAQYPAIGAIGRGTVPEELRPLLDSGRKLLEQAAKSVPSELNLVVKQVCELGNAARVIINTAQREAADLIVTGSRELSSEEREFTVGSVSHRIASHAHCSTLVVKHMPEQIRRVLVAINGIDDAAEIQRWLLANPFHDPVEMTVLHVVPTLEAYRTDTSLANHDRFHEHLHEDSVRWGQKLVDNAAANLSATRAHAHAGGCYKARGHVSSGDPPEVIVRESAQQDLVIVGAYGFQSEARFIYGSVTQKVLHRVAVPVLVIG